MLERKLLLLEATSPLKEKKKKSLLFSAMLIKVGGINLCYKLACSLYIKRLSVEFPCFASWITLQSAKIERKTGKLDALPIKDYLKYWNLEHATKDFWIHSGFVLCFFCILFSFLFFFFFIYKQFLYQLCVLVNFENCLKIPCGAWAQKQHSSNRS